MEMWLMTQADDSIGGIFSNEQKAVEACVALGDYIQPLVVDEIVTREPIYSGGYYPLEGKEESLKRLHEWAVENNIKEE